MANGEIGYLDDVTEEGINSVAGCGGNEVRTWIAAYTVLAASGPYESEALSYHDIAEWNAGMSIAIADPAPQST